MKADQLKIHHLCTNDIGGAARAAARLHEGLQIEGHDSSILVRRKSSSLKRCFEVPLGSLKTSSPSYLSRLKCKLLPARSEVKQAQGLTYHSSTRTPFRPEHFSNFETPDIYNLHWIAEFVDWDSILPWMQSKAPIVWTLHDLNPGQGIWHYQPNEKEKTPELLELDRLEYTTKKRITDSLPVNRVKIVAPSQWISTFARNSQILGRFDIRTIPYGIDTDIYRPIDKVIAREALGLDPRRRIIGMVAHNLLEERKGGQFLEEALNATQGPKPLLLTAGQAIFNRDMGTETLNLSSLDNDRLLRIFYSALDIFICPSKQDNLPNTVIESLACGTPVLGSSAGGIPDMVREGKTGWIFTNGDPNSLRIKMGQALDNIEICREIGRQARQVAESEYGLKLQAERYIKLYQELL